MLRDTIHGDNHAVAAARLDGRWLMLDNRRMAMVEDADVRNYQPTFAIDQHGVMRYADAALLADALGPTRCAGDRQCPWRLSVPSFATPNLLNLPTNN